MTGFINRLFQPKPKTEDTKAENTKPTPKPQSRSSSNQSSGEFFLDDDTAKSLGNLDYMRTASTIKRTFPKTAGSKKDLEIVKQVSSMSQKVVTEGMMASQSTTSQSPSQPENKPSAQAGSEAAAERRRTDTSMDMFRNMAKDLKK